MQIFWSEKFRKKYYLDFMAEVEIPYLFESEDISILGFFTK